MSRRCEFCHAVIYGRSDKRYCSSTCRRDACRARTRIVRIGGTTLVASEWTDWVSRQTPKLEREHGPHHRVVHRARRWAEEIREEQYKKVVQEMARLEGDGDDRAGPSTSG